MQKLRYVFWDWNGTLLNDVDTSISAMNAMLAQRGISALLSKEKYREVFCFPVIRYYQSAGLDMEKEPFERLANEYIERYNKLVHASALYPEALAALDYIKSRDIKQCILSATKTEHLMSQLKPFNITGYFESILGINDAFARSKIDTGIKWVRSNGINPEEILFIGDTIHDYEVAAALGCRCLLIADGHQSRALLSSCPCEIEDSVGAVVKHIE
jgi:phosphoglycolate phosphatase